MMSADGDRLAELEARLDSLLRRRRELNDLADKRKKTRDELNEAVRSLRDRAGKEREERDGYNEKVAEVKAKITELREKLGDKNGSLSRLDQEQERQRGGLPSRRRLENDLQRVEWELATTPTLEIRDREDELVERARGLKALIEEHNRLDALEDRRLESMADSQAVRVEIRGHRDEMQAIRDQGQEHHELMLQLYRKAEEEKGRADEAHASFVEALASIKEVNAEIDAFMPELKELRGKLRRSERSFMERRDRSMRERREELRAIAMKKLESGEKLSLDEMKLIYGED